MNVAESEKKTLSFQFVPKVTVQSVLLSRLRDFFSTTVGQIGKED